MAAATRNHAAEFLPGGICAAEQITRELRERFSGMPMTSTGAERCFALGRGHDISAGASRDDTRAGVILGHADSTVAGMRERADGEEEWRLLRKRARQGLKVTMLEKRIAAGLAQQETRKAKLAAQRAKRAAKATERARIDAVPLAEHYSDLKLMGVEDLRDQHKKHKLLGKIGFALSLPNRTAYVVQLQVLLLEANNEDANDLEDGDSGIDGRSVRRRATVRGRTRRRGLRSYTWAATEWIEKEESEEAFEVEAVVGK
eukprot:5715120-Pleurochrysis_carterae.AAC.1